MWIFPYIYVNIFSGYLVYITQELKTDSNSKLKFTQQHLPHLPHATRKGTQSFTIHCRDKGNWWGLNIQSFKLQLAWHYFYVTLQWCAILFLKYQGWGFSAPNVRMANIINSIWFLNGLSILQAVSFYKKNPQNIEMKLLYS